METGTVTYGSLCYLVVLLVPIIVINLKLKIFINKKLVWAVFRMVVQLSLVGLFLKFVFEIDNPLINVAYVCCMILVAAISGIKSCDMGGARLFFPILVAFALPSLFMLAYFNMFVADLDHLLNARHTIPIAGMLLGNSLSSIIIGVNTFYKGVSNNRKEYLYSLSLSNSRVEALMPYLRKGLLAVANPMLAGMETIGLVALPGMMTGQILGGALPMTAIKYQIAIMLAIFMVQYLAVILAIVLTSMRSFDSYDQLIA
jgi:putative ABC transport system permease protein